MNTATTKLKNSRLVDGKAMQIVGLSETYKEGKNDFSAQWKKFVPHLGKIPGQKSNVAYGVMLEAAGGLEYLAGVEVSGSSEPDGKFKQITFPARKYAVFPHDGPVFTIWKTLDAIHKDWVPASGQVPAEKLLFIERYGEKFDPATASGDIEIWVPLKS